MLKSVLVAGALGAGILWALTLIDPQYSVETVPATLGVGFAVGAGVQLSVRLLGVS